MAIAELYKFRDKYPQYKDIDDVTLANKLAEKYPQYSDLPDKLAQETQPKLRQPFSFIKNERFRQGVEDISAPSAHFVNQFLFNQPRAIARKAGFEYPEAENPFMNVVAKTSGVAGGASGGGKLAKTLGIGKKVLQAPFLSKVGQAAKFGGTAGAITSPEEPTDMGTRALQAILGAGFGVAGVTAGTALSKTGKFVSNLPKAIKIFRDEPEFAQRVRAGFQKKRIDAMDSFGQELDNLVEKNPNNPVNFKEAIDRASASFDKETYALINNTPDLKRIVERPELSSTLNAREAQNILNKIVKVKDKRGPQYNDVRDFYYDLREALADAYPNDIPLMREKYKDVAEPYRLIRSKIKEGQLLKNLANKFGDEELNKKAESLMTKELKGEVDAYRQTKSMLKTMGIVGRNVGMAGAAGAGAGLIFGGR